MVEDDILSDILGEIDTNNVEIRPCPISATRRSSKERNEKKLVHQFMQEFTKSTAVENEAKADDVILYGFQTFSINLYYVFLQDLIEEMFKKNKTKPKPLAVEKPVPSRPSATSLAPRKEIPSNKPLEPPSTKTVQTPGPPTNEDDFANMDYSVLEDNENQFESNKPPAIDTTISEAESYSTLFQNWENTCNMMTDDQVDTASASISDEASAITDEVIRCTDKFRVQCFNLWFVFSQSSVRFWLWDAWEDPYKRPGQIFLFGKIAAEGKSPSEYISACIKVENIDRCLYMLPREFVSN